MNPIVFAGEHASVVGPYEKAPGRKEILKAGDSIAIQGQSMAIPTIHRTSH